MTVSIRRLLLGFITIGLILLISIQILMRFEESEKMLRWAEKKLGVLRSINVEEVSVNISNEMVTLKLLNPGNYSQARVLINNERAYYFEKPTISIPVSDGDFLIIDTRGISEPLWFEIIDFSKDIVSLKHGQQFRVKNGLEVIEIIFRQQKII